eukprot:gene10089-7983_t
MAIWGSASGIEDQLLTARHASAHRAQESLPPRNALRTLHVIGRCEKTLMMRYRNEQSPRQQGPEFDLSGCLLHENGYYRIRPHSERMHQRESLLSVLTEAKTPIII